MLAALCSTQVEIGTLLTLNVSLNAAKCRSELTKNLSKDVKEFSLGWRFTLYKAEEPNHTARARNKSLKDIYRSRQSQV